MRFDLLIRNEIARSINHGGKEAGKQNDSAIPLMCSKGGFKNVATKT